MVEFLVIRSVVVFLLKDGQVCLGRKKTGHGLGKWNGFGGHCEENEPSVTTAVRELHEESGLIVIRKNLVKVAELDYKEENEWLVSVYTTTLFFGEPKTSNEMEPKWFPINNMPWPEMWPNDKLWLTKVLEGKKFKATFYHDKEGKLLKSEFKRF